MRKRSIVLSFSLFLSLVVTLLSDQGSEILPIKSIPISQMNAPLLYAADFIVAEDGIILIADAKDGNIKCYDPEGNLLRIIGRRGPGPNEFLGPSFCDYQAPFFSVLDSPKFKVHIYEREGRTNLSKVAEVSCMMCTSDVILSGKGILVDAFVHNNGTKYFLTLRNFQGEILKRLLPIERRYGYESERSYKANYEDLSMLTAQRGFLSVWGNRAFFILDVIPRIVSVGLDDLEIIIFGTPSPNYREPRINPAIRNAFTNKESEPLKRERQKVSYITGILSDERMVGILFSNYDALSDSWKLYLQRYDLEGSFLSEDLLREATNYDSFFNYYFQRDIGILHVMAEIYGDDSDEYRILGYKLR